MSEHVLSAKNVEVENFITKHWATKHRNLEEFPKMSFKVVRQCKDALTRQISEAVWIENCANMNSKAEWGRNSLSRLVVDKAPWEIDEDGGKKDGAEEKELQAFKEEKKKGDVENKKVKEGFHKPRREASCAISKQRKRKGEVGARGGKRAKIDLDLEPGMKRTCKSKIFPYVQFLK